MSAAEHGRSLYVHGTYGSVSQDGTGSWFVLVAKWNERRGDRT